MVSAKYGANTWYKITNLESKWLSKEHSNFVALFNMSQYNICPKFDDFLYHVITQLRRAHRLRTKNLYFSMVVNVG